MFRHFRLKPHAGMMNRVLDVANNMQATTTKRVKTTKLAVHENHRKALELLRQPHDRLLDNFILEWLYSTAQSQCHVIGRSICCDHDDIEFIAQCARRWRVQVNIDAAQSILDCYAEFVRVNSIFMRGDSNTEIIS